MGQTNDCIHASLSFQGFDGQINDQLYQWFNDQVLSVLGIDSIFDFTKGANDLTGNDGILTIRDAFAHIIQTTPKINTYDPNTAAFVEDVGMVVEQERTNYAQNSVLNGSENNFPEWGQPGSTGTATPQPSILDPSINAVRFVANSQRPFLQSVNPRPMGENDEFVMSCYIESVEGGDLLARDVLLPLATSGAIDVTYPPCEANPSGTQSGSIQPGLLYVTAVCTTSGNLTIRFGVGTNGAETGIAVQSVPQFEDGLYPTSPIYSGGFAPTRPATDARWSVFRQKGTWKDSAGDGGSVPLTVGYFDGAGYTSGVGPFGGNIKLYMATSKYGNANTLNPGGVGAILDLPNGIRLELASFIDNGQWEVRTLINKTGLSDEDAVRAAIGNNNVDPPNPFSLDLTWSDFWTGDFPADTGTINTLRQNAGDDIFLLESAQIFPDNDFILHLKIKLQGIPEDNAVLFANENLAGDDRFNLYKQANGFLTVQHRKDGADTILNTNVELTDPEQELDIQIKLNQATLSSTVNGVEASIADANTVDWYAWSNFGSKPLTSGSRANVIVQQAALQTILSDQVVLTEKVAWDFSQTDYDKAIQQQVGGNDIAQNIRGGLKYATQSVVKTPPLLLSEPNEPALDLGQGWIIENQRTNLLEESNRIDLPPWQTNVLFETGFPAPDGSLDGCKLTEIGTQDRRTQTITAYPDDKGCFSVYVKAFNKGTPTRSRLFVFNQTLGSAVATNSFMEIGQHPQSGEGGFEEVGDGWYRYWLNFDTADGYTPGDNLIFYVYVLEAENPVLVWGAQVENTFNRPTELIPTKALSVFLDQDRAEISAFIEPGLWVDDPAVSTVPCALGNFNSGAWVNGVNGPASRFTFQNGGKYEGDWANEAKGAWIYNEDGEGVLCLARLDANQVTLQRDQYTDEELVEKFGYPRQLRVDFTRSDFWTGDLVNDTAAVAFMREQSGDDVSGYKTPEVMDWNNFKINMQIEILENLVDQDQGFAWIAGAAADADNYIQVTFSKADPNRIALELRNGGVDPGADIVFLPDNIEAGDVLNIEIENRRGFGRRMIVNGINSSLKPVTVFDWETNVFRFGKAQETQPVFMPIKVIDFNYSGELTFGVDEYLANRQFNDLEYFALKLNSIPGEQINDMWYNFYKIVGAVGEQYSDLKNDYWCRIQAPPPPAPPFPTAFNEGFNLGFF